jgi:hypothetical protein
MSLSGGILGRDRHAMIRTEKQRRRKRGKGVVEKKKKN